MRSTAIVVAIALLAATAGADPKADPAEAAYREGRRLYDLREWDQAIAKFKEAYSLRADAASLFNIAQAYRLAGDCKNAVAFYRTYRRNFPDAKNRATVDDFLRQLEPCPVKPVPDRPERGTPDRPSAGPTRPEPARPEPTRPEPARPEPARPEPAPVGVERPAPAVPGHGGRALRVGGIAVMACGAVAGGASVYFALAARSKANAVSSGSGIWDPGLESAGRSDAHDAAILAIAGGAAIAAGAVALWLGVRADAAPIAVAPGRGGATMVWSCAF